MRIQRLIHVSSTSALAIGSIVALDASIVVQRLGTESLLDVDLTDPSDEEDEELDGARPKPQQPDAHDALDNLQNGVHAPHPHGFGFFFAGAGAPPVSSSARLSTFRCTLVSKTGPAP